MFIPSPLTSDVKRITDDDYYAYNLTIKLSFNND